MLSAGSHDSLRVPAFILTTDLPGGCCDDFFTDEQTQAQRGCLPPQCTQWVDGRLEMELVRLEILALLTPPKVGHSL